ncbi:MAG TPA: sigma-70 family RNA polymerase sigma factor [Gemmatimonadaceae bacterium]|nr:sigma-70 family RNA polymerase sigma factor [Gemmatimonadaceae bacterium]
MDSSQERTLATRIRSGDREALATVYRTYYEALWRFAYLLVRSRETAQDITQDVFLNLWTQRESIDVREDFRVYLYAAIRKRAWNVGRHERVVAAVETGVEQGGIEAPAVGSHIVVPDEAAEAEAFQAAYRKALTALPDRDRTAALLRWEEEMTFAQIGEVLGISAMGARGMVLRAQERIQTLLRDYRPDGTL